MTAELVISGLRSDPPRLSDEIDLVANIEADLRLAVDGQVVYEEVSFPVVELALALVRWLATPPDDRSGFEFDSMSAEEPGLIWIRRVGDGWRVGSIHQERSDLRALTSVEIEALIRGFVAQISDGFEARFGSSAWGLLDHALGTLP